MRQAMTTTPNSWPDPSHCEDHTASMTPRTAVEKHQRRAHTLPAMRRRILLLVAIGCVGAGLAGCGGTTHAAGPPHPPRRASSQLVGVTFNGPVLASSVNLDQQMKLAVGSGVESLRVGVDWAALQPYR